MKPRSFYALVLLTALSLLLASCGPTTTTAPTEEQAPAEAAAPAAPAAEQPPARRVLRITFSWPNRIDPAVGNDYASSTSLANLYDTLVFPNAKGLVDPWLAESWEISDDGLTYTFHLRSGVKFHDGTPLKASDVVYSFNRLREIGEGYAYLVTPDVENVTAVDDATVEFKLKRATALFLPSLVRPRHPGRAYGAAQRGDRPLPAQPRPPLRPQRGPGEAKHQGRGTLRRERRLRQGMAANSRRRLRPL